MKMTARIFSSVFCSLILSPLFSLARAQATPSPVATPNHAVKYICTSDIAPGPAHDREIAKCFAEHAPVEVKMPECGISFRMPASWIVKKEEPCLLSFYPKSCLAEKERYDKLPPVDIRKIASGELGRDDPNLYELSLEAFQIAIYRGTYEHAYTQAGFRLATPEELSSSEVEGSKPRTLVVEGRLGALSAAEEHRRGKWKILTADVIQGVYFRHGGGYAQIGTKPAKLYFNVEKQIGIEVISEDSVCSRTSVYTDEDFIDSLQISHVGTGGSQER